MLSDRSYMRSDYPRQSTSALTWILCATFAGSVIQFAVERFARSGAFEGMLALSPYGMQQGRIWTIATYTLLHGGILHLLLNALGLFLIGREVAPLLGNRRFLTFYAAAAIVGGITWLAVHYFTGSTVLMGASACVAAIFILFACIYPEREITFLVFFVLPVTLKPKILAWILLGVDSLGFVFSELPGGGFDTGIAHSAHLGGMLTGWLYYRYFHANAGLDRAAGPLFQMPKWLRRSEAPPPPAAPRPPAARRNPGVTAGDAALRAEVDRILDKINSQGFGALTDDEKRLLDDAKDILSRR
jgi:membrane associated rhomboid family serine protease